MQSKISFFNKIFFVKNIKKNIWFMVANLFILLIPVFNLILSLLENERTGNRLDILYDSWGKCLNSDVFMILNHSDSTFALVVAGIFAVFVTANIFSYLYSTKTAYMISAFPVTRMELFCTGVISATLVLLVPQIIVSVINLLIGISFQIEGILIFVLYNLLCQVLMTVFWVSLSVFTAMMSGQIITSMILYFVFNFIYFAMYYAIRTTLSHICLGVSDFLSSKYLSYFTPFSVVYDEIGGSVTVDEIQNNAFGVLRSWGCVGILVAYIFMALILLLLAFVMYKKKHMETVADFIAVPVLKPVFRWLFSFFASLFISALIIAVTDAIVKMSVDGKFYLTLILMIFLGTLIFLGSQMLIERNYRVFSKKFNKELGLFLVLIIVFFAAFKLDLFGVEKHVPNISNIESVELFGNRNATITDKEEIEKVIELQKQLIECRKDLRMLKEGEEGIKIHITYYLKGGNAVSRIYPVPYPDGMSEEYKAAYNAITDEVNDPDFILKYLVLKDKKTLKEYEGEVHAGALCFDRYTYDKNGWNIYTEYFEKEVADAVWQGYIEDIKAGYVKGLFLPVSPDGTGKNYINSFCILACDKDFNPFISESDIIVPETTGTVEYCYDNPFESYNLTGGYYIYFDINSDCRNTIQAMIDTGIIKSADDLVLSYDYENKWDR